MLFSVPGIKFWVLLVSILVPPANHCQSGSPLAFTAILLIPQKRRKGIVLEYENIPTADKILLVSFWLKTLEGGFLVCMCVLPVIWPY